MFSRIVLIIALSLGLTTFSLGQIRHDSAPLTGVARKAFTYFDQVEGHRFDEFLRRISLERLSPELKVKALNMLCKEDLADPSAEGRIKLRTLDPILKYHERDSIIELRVLRVHTAMTAFLAGAAILVTEPALEILNSEELQAVVAHELGHEYYWGEFELARQHQQHLEVQELELRCDGIGIITLNRLGLNPESLSSAIAKLNQHNQQYGSVNSENYVPCEERFGFIKSMIEFSNPFTRNQEVMAPMALAQTSRAVSATSYLERGNEWMAKGELDRAIADYTLAIAFDARAAVAYYNRSLARNRKGDLSGALSDCNRAIELNPRFGNAYLFRGAIRYGQGQFDAAISDYSKAIEINPRDTGAWMNRGSARCDQGDFDAAIADFNQAINLDSRNADALSSRCAALYRLGALDAAIADCDRSLKLDARHAIAWNNRGAARQEKGELDGALADSNRAIELDQQQASFYSNRGKTWLLKGEVERSLSDLNHALTLNPKMAEAWNHRGAVWFAKQSYTQAVADFDQALKLDPRLADAYGNRGIARLMQDRLAEAEADIARLRELGGSLKPEAERLLREVKERHAPR